MLSTIQTLKISSSALVLLVLSSAVARPILGEDASSLKMLISSEYLKAVAPPAWSHGLVVLRNVEPAVDEPQVVVINPKGDVVSKIRISLPDVSEVHVYDAAVTDQSGSVVISAALIGGGQRAFALCFVDSAGKLTEVVRTNPFSATRLQVAANGSIWALGANGEGMADPKLELFRKFSADGVEQGRYLPRSTSKTVHDGFHPAILTELGRPSLVSSADRVAAYLPESQEWIEFTMDGDLAGRLKATSPKTTAGVPLRAGTVVMMANNEVFGWFSGADSSGLYELDRSVGGWFAVTSDQVASEAGKGLFGVLGDRLVQGLPGSSSGLTLITSEVKHRFSVEMIQSKSRAAAAPLPN